MFVSGDSAPVHCATCTCFTKIDQTMCTTDLFGHEPIIYRTEQMATTPDDGPQNRHERRKAAKLKRKAH